MAVSPDAPAIATVLHFLRAADANDEAAIASLLHDDFVWDQSLLGTVPGLPSIPPVKGKAAAVEFIMSTVGQVDTSCHASNFLTTHRSGGGGYEVKCYFVAHHYRKGEALMPDKEGFVAGGEYTAEVAQSKLVGKWKLRSWHIRPIWGKGDLGVFGPPPS